MLATLQGLRGIDPAGHVGRSGLGIPEWGTAVEVPGFAPPITAKRQMMLRRGKKRKERNKFSVTKFLGRSWGEKKGEGSGETREALLGSGTPGPGRRRAGALQQFPLGGK